MGARPQDLPLARECSGPAFTAVGDDQRRPERIVLESERDGGLGYREEVRNAVLRMVALRRPGDCLTTRLGDDLTAAW